MLDAADSLAQELKRADPSGSHGGEPVQKSIDKAYTLAGKASKRRLGRFQSGVANWLFGVASGSAWAAIHRGSEDLLLIQDAHTLRARAAEIAADLTNTQLAANPRAEMYRQEAERLSKLASYGPYDRQRLRDILHWMNKELEEAHGRVRAFRAALYAATFFIAIAVAGVCVAGIFDPSGLRVCPRGTGCLHSAAPSKWDLGELAGVGALSGLVAGATTLARLGRSKEPFSPGIAQGLLKMPLGAALAILGVLFISHGGLPAVRVENGLQVLALAVLFGLAQQLLTRLVDSRADDLVAGYGKLKQAQSTDQPRSEGSDQRNAAQT